MIIHQSILIKIVTCHRVKKFQRNELKIVGQAQSRERPILLPLKFINKTLMQLLHRISGRKS